MWKVEEYENHISETSIRVVDGEGLTVADNEPYYPAKITSENAETIVSAINEVADLREQLATALKERDHWKANHAEMVQRNAVLRERPDLPVDRLPAIARYEAQLATAHRAIARLSTYEAFTTEGWGFAHPEITARVEFARTSLGGQS